MMSTPTRYVESLKREKEVQWPTKDVGDLFPYQTNGNHFWTGYYSSRPALKKQVKDASAIFGAE